DGWWSFGFGWKCLCGNRARQLIVRRQSLMQAQQRNDMTIDKHLIDTNLLAPEVVTDPYPWFHTLQLIDPVHWSERHCSWLLTSYADVSAAFKDPKLSADRISPFFTRRANDPELDDLDPMFKILSNWMVFKDPPDHTRLRRL